MIILTLKQYGRPQGAYITLKNYVKSFTGRSENTYEYDGAHPYLQETFKILDHDNASREYIVGKFASDVAISRYFYEEDKTIADILLTSLTKVEAFIAEKLNLLHCNYSENPTEVSFIVSLKGKDLIFTNEQNKSSKYKLTLNDVNQFTLEKFHPSSGAYEPETSYMSHPIKTYKAIYGTIGYPIDGIEHSMDPTHLSGISDIEPSSHLPAVSQNYIPSDHEEATGQMSLYKILSTTVNTATATNTTTFDSTATSTTTTHAMGGAGMAEYHDDLT